MNQGNERTTSMSKTKGLVQMAIFAALIVVLAFTPFIGYIPLGFTRATIIHIPVIMGSLMLGPKKGAALGGVYYGNDILMTNSKIKTILIRGATRDTDRQYPDNVWGYGKLNVIESFLQLRLV